MADLIADLRALLADERCLCSSAHTDWEGVAALLDRLDAAEAQAHNLAHEVDRVRGRLWRLAALAGHVPHESDNDATAELAVTQALATPAIPPGERA